MQVIWQAGVDQAGDIAAGVDHQVSLQLDQVIQITIAGWRRSER
jgi:hypothetical protein